MTEGTSPASGEEEHVVADEKLSPETAVRTLRAKAAELENRVDIERSTGWMIIRRHGTPAGPFATQAEAEQYLQEGDHAIPVTHRTVTTDYLAADVALVAQLLAAHIERTDDLDHRFELFRQQVLDAEVLP